MSGQQEQTDKPGHPEHHLVQIGPLDHNVIRVSGGQELVTAVQEEDEDSAGCGERGGHDEGDPLHPQLAGDVREIVQDRSWNEGEFAYIPQQDFSSNKWTFV